MSPPNHVDVKEPLPASQPCRCHSGVPPGGLRVALYSHDTMGMGHMRRNLLIAQWITSTLPQATVLMIAGAKEASALAIPRGVDCVTLPALCKDLDGDYRSRNLRITLRELIELRSSAIAASVASFRPHVLIVDKVPRGASDELIPTLELLKRRGTTKCVLGLREVLDEKSATWAQWRASGTMEVIRDGFDAVWVYGDPRVFNLVDEYGLPDDIAEKVHFTGYLDQCQRADFMTGTVPDWAKRAVADPFVLCVVGGGQDGGQLARTFVDAVCESHVHSVLLTGPYMSAADRRELQDRIDAAEGPVHMLEFVPEADWLISRAERVVCMGGYNTTCSVLSFEKPALIVPRIRPRSEQLMRARRLQSLGLVDMLHPNALNASRLQTWITSPRRARPAIRPMIDLNGLPTIGRLVSDITGTRDPHHHQYCHVIS